LTKRKYCETIYKEGGSMENTINKSVEWLDGYNLDKLNDLQKIYQPIAEIEPEQYRSYMKYTKSDYNNALILIKYIQKMDDLLVSNHGNIKYKGLIIESSLVGDGPRKGLFEGKFDNYKEIIFPDISVKYTFYTYRLVAETWCNNPDPNLYTTVHHIGNDNFDNKNNLLFVTNNQHFSIKHNWMYNKAENNNKIQDIHLSDIERIKMYLEEAKEKLSKEEIAFAKNQIKIIDEIGYDVKKKKKLQSIFEDISLLKEKINKMQNGI
jgi:hypothetical protein